VLLELLMLALLSRLEREVGSLAVLVWTGDVEGGSGIGSVLTERS